jgi:glutathione S-transferase
MYTLYHFEGACSLATMSILIELGIDSFKIVNQKNIENFEEINPTGAVPVLSEGDNNWREGAALVIYLLDKHDNFLMPKRGIDRQVAIQNIMFANATMHPAYGRLFFLAGAVEDDGIKQKLMNAAASMINDLWEVVDKLVGSDDYLSGNSPSAADFMLTVYYRWGAFFPINLVIPENAQRMINNTLEHPSFRKALKLEKAMS